MSDWVQVSGLPLELAENILNEDDCQNWLVQVAYKDGAGSEIEWIDDHTVIHYNYAHKQFESEVHSYYINVVVYDDDAEIERYLLNKGFDKSENLLVDFVVYSMGVE